MHVVRVSLNAHDANSYEKLCRPQFGRSTFDSVLEFASRCSTLMELEISAVELPGIDLDIIQRITKQMGGRFHLRNYHGPPEILDEIAQLLTDT